jgi:hypothetical protein
MSQIREKEVMRMSIEQEIPFEINDHLKVFGKEANDVNYNGVGPGPFCGSRIDQFNFCACGGKLVVD